MPAVPPDAIGIVLHPEVDRGTLRQLHPQIDARDVFLPDQPIRHDPRLRHPADRAFQRPDAAVHSPERPVLKEIQLIVHPREVLCVGAVLLVPQTLARVVDEQRPVMTFILHADEVLSSGAARDSIVVELRPEAAADLLRQTPVVHANAHPRFVIQPVVHHDEALGRPILHARALLHDHLMRARGRRIHPMEAVFLEENRTVGQRRRAGPLPVRAAARAP